MVAKANPKEIEGAEDLGRDDLVQSYPTPRTEGIMTFYGLAMLKDLGLYDKVTNGPDCKGCWGVADKVWFTDAITVRRRSASRTDLPMSETFGRPK